MARVRSPNYPQLSLPEAITRIALVFGKERQHPAPRDVVIKHIGYTSVNGASLGALSALLKYGLLERSGEDFRVADRALSILYPDADETKKRALIEAILAPALFQEIFTQFKGVLPSDDNLKSYLIRQGFADSGAAAVIRVLRQSVEIVPDVAGPYDVDLVAVDGGKPVQTQSVTSAAKAPPPSATVPVEPPAKNDWRVSMTAHGLELNAILLDKEGVLKLIAVLNATIPLLPEKAEPPKLDRDRHDRDPGLVDLD